LKKRFMNKGIEKKHNYIKMQEVAKRRPRNSDG
jgi:hypothetical protein